MGKRNMQVILRQEVQGLGKKGEMVGVKPGYARNFLFPNGAAVRVTPGLIKEQEMRKEQEKARLQSIKAQALSYKTALDTIGRFVLRQKVGEGDLLFGTVTNSDIAGVILATSGLDIDRRNISFEGEINKTGVFTVQVKLHPEVTAEVRIQVTPE
ncbi:MAG: 50S ribosomal protein L9 [Synechococcaceae cyanobacterium SM2_3_2]|nr:50S ribosomal protein L9 [Synechococcaceae cyanobacterium SM2_3_2]